MRKHRKTDRDIERQIHRQTDRQASRHGQRKTDRDIERQIHWQTDRQADTDREGQTETGAETDRQIDMQRKTDRQTDKQTQKDRHANTDRSLIYLCLRIKYRHLRSNCSLEGLNNWNVKYTQNNRLYQVHRFTEVTRNSPNQRQRNVWHSVVRVNISITVYLKWPEVIQSHLRYASFSRVATKQVMNLVDIIIH